MKDILKSKRFWTGIIGIITSVSLIFTGEQLLSNLEFLTELFMGVWGFVQTIIALTSTDTITIKGQAIK